MHKEFKQLHFNFIKVSVADGVQLSPHSSKSTLLQIASGIIILNSNARKPKNINPKFIHTNVTGVESWLIPKLINNLLPTVHVIRGKFRR